MGSVFKITLASYNYGMFQVNCLICLKESQKLDPILGYSPLFVILIITIAFQIYH